MVQLFNTFNGWLRPVKLRSSVLRAMFGAATNKLLTVTEAGKLTNVAPSTLTALYPALPMFTVWFAAGNLWNDQFVIESQRALVGFVQLLTTAGVNWRLSRTSAPSEVAMLL